MLDERAQQAARELGQSNDSEQQASGRQTINIYGGEFSRFVFSAETVRFDSSEDPEEEQPSDNESGQEGARLFRMKKY